ncbi:MAG: phosphoribosylamine--glycine ligase [Ktedonobacteraceae bacterium]|nr:phosphoribosylamine--glycine ligase [Ktedonobacteraceae bacterium]
MKILVIGSGAREHALVWKLAQSARVSQLYAAPGNPGIALHAQCLPFAVSQFTELADFAEQKQVDLTIVGPEAPLIDGIADVFRRRGLPIFGPNAAGAALEGSKAFAKEVMTGAGIPTARHRTFTVYAQALAYLEEHGAPVVVKASGNAAGKGAIVALDMETARSALKQIMIDRAFGTAGDVVVIEECLQGDEIGVTAICNGTNFLPLTLTQDHKRALDHDQGPNTGGMGVYTPLPFVNRSQEELIHQQIIAATLRAIASRGINFTGVLYSNLMLTERGPMVLEHNTRFGDPEAQAQMLLMRADLLDVLSYPAMLTLDPADLWYPGYAVSLTLASGGYPSQSHSGYPITGVEEANRMQDVQVFHAGTALKDGQLVTAGGRVLSVAARGTTLREAVTRAYEAAKLIHFERVHYRRDIAWRGLQS